MSSTRTCSKLIKLHTVLRITHIRTYTSPFSLCLSAFPSQTPVVTHTLAYVHSLSHTHTSSLTLSTTVPLCEACLAPNCEALLIRALLLSTDLLQWSHPLPITSFLQPTHPPLHTDRRCALFTPCPLRPEGVKHCTQKAKKMHDPFL